jgi:Cysteine rich repeat
MKLRTVLSTVPIFSLMAMAALADDAAMPPPGGPAAVCKQDVQTLCPGIQPGGGRIVACLKSHAEQVSPDCKAAIKAARGHHGHQPPGSEPPAEGPTSN